ncbi:MAG: von Willebrand factor type A domain-containing protein [Gemmatimonadetes bacterium]|nr:von Willebrand factor type A domain-containing protein [Gemmatimonadota bacterium]
MRSFIAAARKPLAGVVTALALGLAPLNAHGQTGSIVGQVTEASSGQPLAGAVVAVEGTGHLALTNDAGRYGLEGVPAGARTVTVEMVGYASQRLQVTVVPGQTTVMNVVLRPAAVQLDELRIRAGQPRAEALQRARTDLSVVAVQYERALDFNTESYARIEENDFRLVSASPLSTFSIDVDRASYANIRRFIQAGDRPPIDAVRIEEMINYFPYDWGNVRGDHPFSVTTEVWEAPWEREHRLVRIGLHAESIDTDNLPPGNLVFLLDVSGSMTPPDKLPLLKKAFGLLVDQLRPEDRVAIVVYAGAAGLVLPSTPGDQKGEILAALDDLQAGGSTAGGAGLRLAYDVARKHHIDGGNNRVILATDGDFNVGASSDAEMVHLIEKERESGTFLTVLGFGTGNLKDSKMEQIADHGNGNFHYVDGLLEARKVLVEEMGGTLLTLARDVKLQVEFNPARAAGYRLIGYENRLLADEDFNDDTKDAGELGAGHTVTALYEVVPAGVEVPRGDVDALRYQPQPDDPPLSDFDDELIYVKVRYKDPDGTRSKLLQQAVADRPRSPSTDFRFAAAVAGFGMLLRDSQHAGDLTLDDVVTLAEKGKGGDPRGYRGEFIRLVEATRDLGLLKLTTPG